MLSLLINNPLNYNAHLAADGNGGDCDRVDICVSKHNIMSYRYVD